MRFGASMLLLAMLVAASLLWRAAALSGPYAPGDVTVIDSLPYTITSPGVYVLEVDLSTSGDGIIVASPNVVIRGGGHRITGSGVGSGILMDGNLYNLENITVEDLVIEGFSLGVDIEYVDSDARAFTGIVLSNLEIRGCDTGIYTTDTDYYGLVIRDTFIADSYDSGIYAEYAYGGMYIINVTVAGSGADDYGIYIYGEGYHGYFLYDCEIYGTYWEGIYVEESGYVTISNCWVHDTMDDGIEVYNSEYVLIIRTISEGNWFDGLYVDYGDTVWVVDSVFRDNEDYGIDIYDSYNVYISGAVVADNWDSGIYVDDYSDNVVITHSQIINNDGYGVEAYNDPTYDLEVSWNVFGSNTESPQAYDEDGVGNWHDNYWSDLSGTTYSFDFNTDPSPLAEPFFDVRVTNVSVPGEVLAGTVVDVRARLRNEGFAPATGVPVSLFWGEPMAWEETGYTWFNLDASSATNVTRGDIVEDFGNYTLWDWDDGYFIYKLPWPIELYGYKYTYLSISTNGYVELLNSTSSVLEGWYTVHSKGRHRNREGAELYGMGVSTIFAFSGDLYGDYYVGIFNLANKSLVVFFNGTTYRDQDPETNPVQYQIILRPGGSITVSLGDIGYGRLDGDGFMGLYVQPLGMEVGFYMPLPYTSWTINTALHPADTTTASLAPGEETDVTLHWDTSRLPHLSPFTLWVAANPSGTGETSLGNSVSAPTVILVSPSPGAVGGVLVAGGETGNTLAVVAGALLLASAAVLVAAYRRGRRAG